MRTVLRVASERGDGLGVVKEAGARDFSWWEVRVEGRLTAEFLREIVARRML